MPLLLSIIVALDKTNPYMSQFTQEGIFGSRTSKICSSSRTAADYKIDLPNNFWLACLINLFVMFGEKMMINFLRVIFMIFMGPKINGKKIHLLKLLEFKSILSHKTNISEVLTKNFFKTLVIF